jgi:chromate reductase
MALIVLIGGISRQSINRKLFAQLKTVSAMEFDLFEIAALPFFSQDLEVELPAEVVDFKKRIRAAEGVLVITPEYNRSIPGVLKNAVDWGSRPWGENSLSDKPAAIMGASTGAVATFGAQQHLRNVMSFLNMHVMSQPEYYLNFTANVNSDGVLNSGAMEIAANFMKAVDKWVKIFAR